ncbi:MAG TPA: SDR family oxidoreductase [Oligoflexus sp.]|uniref:SDR family NAD(P)-dependent oxidoreductase n=1 Tax=Oligoflexus sp. TaxID=1971216 RepID=UPI002D62C4E1|nr:SDR family oxidoreductase [Oligoflexus sp.]HYX35636.1 SDR family oxidoreductase [Oligoflexus sp.]
MKTRFTPHPWALRGLAFAGGYYTFRRVRSFFLTKNLQGKIVLITGGSKGLGMILARNFAREGARVAICARSVEELEKARSWIHKEAGASILAVPCDVSHPDEVDLLVNHVSRVYGPIDILVNNAGTIAVAPLEATNVDDFKRAQDSMFWGMLYPTFAVLRSMRERKRGQIVNITSIGAIISVPHLIPYSSAKFAALGFSLGLYTELKPHGIKVTTILPGLMRTGSFINAEFKGLKEKEYKWFSVAASLPFLSLSAERAASKIMDAVVNEASFRILGLPAQVGATLYSIFPQFSLFGLSLINRLLPKGDSSLRDTSPPTAGKHLKKDKETATLRLLKGLGTSAIKSYQT